MPKPKTRRMTEQTALVIERHFHPDEPSEFDVDVPPMPSTAYPSCALPDHYFEIQLARQNAVKAPVNGSAPSLTLVRWPNAGAK